MKKHSNDKSTMTMTDNHVPRNGYGTWNRYR